MLAELSSMQGPRPLSPDCPFWERRVTVALVEGEQMVYSHDVAGKEVALEALVRNTKWLCFAAWTGRYTTDLFLITGEEATRLLAERANRLKSSKFPR